MRPSTTNDDYDRDRDRAEIRSGKLSSAVKILTNGGNVCGTQLQYYMFSEGQEGQLLQYRRTLVQYYKGDVSSVCYSVVEALTGASFVEVESAGGCAIN